MTYIKLATELVGDAGDQYTGLDRFGRIVDQRWINSSNTDVDRYQYGYDRDSNCLFKDNKVISSLSEVYTYDSLNQLASYKLGTLNGTKTDVTGSPITSQSWDYDGVGNWDSSTTNSTTQTRSANKQNEITSVSGATTPTYDSNGNLTTDENNYRFVYDAWNRLVQVKNSSNVVIVTYGRDALHRHVTDTVGSTVTDRFFSSDWQVLETKVGSNTVTRNVWSPVYVDGLVLRDRDTDGNGSLDERLYALQDANWNTTGLVNAGGTVQERYTYAPFGQVTFRDGSGSTLSGSAKDWVFLHQGGERIAAGDYEFRNRVYSLSLGRWLTNDPLGFNAGDQNWYRAVGNNPGNGGDPEGLIATFKEPVLSPIGPNGMSIEPDQPYFAPSGDWFGDFSNYSAGLGDTVTIGITKRIRTWVGYDDVVNYDSGAYVGGQYTGIAVNVGLGVVNPCALGSAVAIPVRLINAGQAIGGTINAAENIANGNYWEAGFDLVGVAGNASQVVRPCFAAGTPIRTGSGAILIENLKAGDVVLSRNESDPDGQVDGKIVEEVFVRSANILNVIVQGRVIRTTSEHPFWVDGKGWTAAGELKAGDQLLGADKSKLPVESVVETEDTETVYNFRVADWHTYFVGNEHWDFEVWVHNACASGANGQTPNSNFGVNPFLNGELDAARREAAGEVVKRKANGIPYNHVKELQDAQNGLLNRIAAIYKQLANPALNGATRSALQRELSEASKLLDKTEEFLPR